VLHRLSAVLVCLGLIAGNAAVCAGWAATPEARMACCAEGGDCPMHKGRSEEHGSQRVITQAQADACCAASEQEQSKSSNPTAVTAISPAVLGVGVVLPVITPSLMLTDGWRTDAPIHSPPVARHVLFSVFLV
jgi:predicted metal-binding membrane protein